MRKVKVFFDNMDHNGIFHGFFDNLVLYQGGNTLRTGAIVELCNGTCIAIAPSYIRFLSQPAESESAVGPALHTTGDKSLPADICADCVTESCDSRGTGVVECTGKLCG